MFFGNELGDGHDHGRIDASYIAPPKKKAHHSGLPTKSYIHFSVNGAHLYLIKLSEEYFRGIVKHKQPTKMHQQSNSWRNFEITIPDVWWYIWVVKTSLEIPTLFALCKMAWVYHHTKSKRGNVTDKTKGYCVLRRNTQSEYIHVEVMYVRFEWLKSRTHWCFGRQHPLMFISRGSWVVMRSFGMMKSPGKNFSHSGDPDGKTRV